MKTGRGDSLQLLQQDKIISDEQKKPVGLKENVASKENREGKKKKIHFHARAEFMSRTIICMHGAKERELPFTGHGLRPDNTPADYIFLSV